MVGDLGSPLFVGDVAGEGRGQPGGRERDGGDGPGRQPEFLLEPRYGSLVPTPQHAIYVAQERFAALVRHPSMMAC